MTKDHVRQESENFIVFDKVSKTYHGRAGSAVALSETSFSISRGEFICVVGPSGCGKTTLLNMLAGFLQPTTGQIRVNQRAVQRPGPERGVVFQEIGLFPWLTVLANVEFGLKMAGVPKRERRDKAMAALAMTSMDGYAARYPNELSGGMKQRVGIARVLANDPQVMLMDEPLGALDAQTRRDMQDELLQVWESTGKTIFFITHSIDEALLLGDRVCVMSPSPGRLNAEIKVDLPRPRDENSPSFNDLERRMKDLVRIERSASRMT